MTAVIQDRPGPSGIPPRILVAGSDLLADALASVLETYGFATMNIVASKPAIEGVISWRPDLMLLDARSLDVAAGSALIGGVCQEGVQVCVIDAAGNSDRSNAWLRAGTAALIDNGEPFDELFRTITVLLRSRFLSESRRGTQPLWLWRRLRSAGVNALSSFPCSLSVNRSSSPS